MELLFIFGSLLFGCLVDAQDSQASGNFVLDYLDKFELGMSSSSESSPVCLVRNGVSKPINIPTGFPMGYTTHRRAFVGTNGAISFESVFYDRWPRPFPIRWWNRDHNVVAPFWSDNDIRISGQVCYEVYEGDTDYLSTVNEYISIKTKKEFKGQWMLLAEWDKVHPYPDGQWWWNWYSSSIKEFTKLENTYQAIIVTDGLTSYSLFTYKCNELQWSGYWRHASVGYNAAGNFYTNHPLSGYSQVKELGCIGSESSEVNNLLYQISLSPDFIQRKRVECRNMLREDEELFSNVTLFSKQLQPCPCTMRQSWWDRRYRSDWNSWSSNWNHLCFRERFPNPVNNGSQYCCYKTSWPGWGSLKHYEESGTYGTNMLRYHPRFYSNYDKYDRKLRETCCTYAGLCNEFYKRRPQNNCQGYQPPPRRWGGGDPHITSLDGLTYTFNGLGEYRMVEIDQHQFKMYGRTGKVEGNTKATEFVAFAFAVGNKERVEIQNHKSFAVFHNSSNVTDQLSEVNDTYTSDDENIEITRAAENSVEITFHFGLSVTVNISVGILHYTIAMPNSIEGLVTGLLGNFNGNSTDDLLSPNGTEYNVTNEKDVFIFGESWKVLSINQSIFMVPNPDPDPSFVPEFVEDVVSQANQLVVDACNGDQQCIYDAVQTNNLEVGLATSVIQQNITKEMEQINNFPPVMNGSSSFELDADKLSSYTFSVNDTDSFNITVDTQQLDNGYILTDNQDGTWTFECTWTHSDTRNFTVTFIATDSLGASSILEPKVCICACVNDGTCTTTGTDLSSNPVIFSCECDEDVWSGEFCEKDTDGCETFSCYTGVECQDNPAPQTGATCGDCPVGLSGDGTTCDDIDECEKGLCEQDCINTEGSYTCTCFNGYSEINGSCKDINECEGYNECHQECINTLGSYECSCFDGFIVSSDKRSCMPENPCNKTYALPILCTILDGVEIFACLKGYILDGIYCQDFDECTLEPCDQLCFNSFGSFECHCKYGFNLGVNSRSCSDVDECLEAALNGDQLCSEQLMCVNTEGSYSCGCPDGTMYNNSSRLCEVKPLTTTSPTTSPPSTRAPVYKLLLSDEAIIGISVGGGLLVLFLVCICTVISRSSLFRCRSKVYPGGNNIEDGEGVQLLDMNPQSGDKECISNKSTAAISVATQTSTAAMSSPPARTTVSNMPGQACVEVETQGGDTSVDDERICCSPKDGEPFLKN